MYNRNWWNRLEERLVDRACRYVALNWAGVDFISELRRGLYSMQCILYVSYAWDSAAKNENENEVKEKGA
jgi:hypothetical protein